jgi:hypothetical protein
MSDSSQEEDDLAQWCDYYLGSEAEQQCSKIIHFIDKQFELLRTVNATPCLTIESIRIAYGLKIRNLNLYREEYHRRVIDAHFYKLCKRL